MPPSISNFALSATQSTGSEFGEHEAPTVLASSVATLGLPESESPIELLPAPRDGGLALSTTVHGELEPQLSPFNELTTQLSNTLGAVTERAKSIGEEFARTNEAFQELGAVKAHDAELACTGGFVGARAGGASLGVQTGLGLTSGVCNGGTAAVVASIYGLPALVADPIGVASSTVKSWTFAAEEFLTTADLPRQVQMLAAGATELAPGVLGAKGMAAKSNLPAPLLYREVSGEYLPAGGKSQPILTLGQGAALTDADYAALPASNSLPASLQSQALSTELLPEFSRWGAQPFAFTWGDVGSEFVHVADELDVPAMGVASTEGVSSGSGQVSVHEAEATEAGIAKKSRAPRDYSAQTNTVLAGKGPFATLVNEFGAEQVAGKLGELGDKSRLIVQRALDDWTANDIAIADLRERTGAETFSPQEIKKARGLVDAVLRKNADVLRNKLTVELPAEVGITELVSDALSVDEVLTAPAEPTAAPSIEEVLLSKPKSQFAIFLREGAPEQQQRRLALARDYLASPELRNDRQRTVLTRFFEGATHGEVGTELGLSRRTVGWIESEVVDYLRLVDAGDTAAKKPKTGQRMTLDDSNSQFAQLVKLEGEDAIRLLLPKLSSLGREVVGDWLDKKTRTEVAAQRGRAESDVNRELWRATQTLRGHIDELNAEVKAAASQFAEELQRLGRNLQISKANAPSIEVEPSRSPKEPDSMTWDSTGTHAHWFADTGKPWLKSLSARDAGFVSALLEGVPANQAAAASALYPKEANALITQANRFLPSHHQLNLAAPLKRE